MDWYDYMLDLEQQERDRQGREAWEDYSSSAPQDAMAMNEVYGYEF